MSSAIEPAEYHFRRLAWQCETFYKMPVGLDNSTIHWEKRMWICSQCSVGLPSVAVLWGHHSLHITLMTYDTIKRFVMVATVVSVSAALAMGLNRQNEYLGTSWKLLKIYVRGTRQHFLSMVRKCCWLVVKVPENMRAKHYSAPCQLEFAINSQSHL